MAIIPPNVANQPNVPLLPNDAVNLINRWRLYRDPKAKHFTPEEATAYFRTKKYSEAQIPLPELPPPFVFPLEATPADLAALNETKELTGIRQEFLKRTIPGLVTLAWGG